ncbi:MAG TPA: uracil-DNA glycosylase family protein [Chloroflexia bacterium]|nr:uracil-DNA glycosylase family protein [Chloroflexia bacterium]
MTNTTPEREGGKSASPRLAGMRELEIQVKTCQLCRLAKTRTNAVPGEGYIRTDVMFIGEGPGYHEDKQGRPFVGQAGSFLNELLELAGLQRDRVYITNVVKCRPPNNRDPELDEKMACAPYLERQIALINPKVIVTLGRHSMGRFFPGERISQIHGTARVVDGRLCVEMYHPAAGLHQASLADIIRDDFRKLTLFMEEANARLSTRPMLAEPEQRIEAAEQARAEVVTQPETGTVIDPPVAPVTAVAPEAPEVGATAPAKDGAGDVMVMETPAEYAAIRPVPEVVPEAEQAVEVAVAPVEAAKAKPAARRSKKKSGPQYKQMSFFDL